MVIFVSDQPQENREEQGDSPQHKIVRVEKHEAEGLPVIGKVVVRNPHTDCQAE